jgi:hypothetical protein
MTAPERTTGTLALYAQPWWHCEAFVVGDRDGLVALRAAIDVALESDHGRCQTFVQDGEGYTTHVMIAKMVELHMLRCPYTDGRARDDIGIEPATLLPRKAMAR